jgi:hypothetical protein
VTLAAISAQLASLTTEISYIKLRLPEDNATALTPANYEHSARIFLRDHVLPQWLGLQTVANIRLDRLEVALILKGSRGDFRAPVTIALVPPSMSGSRAGFVIYPTWPAYMRPEEPPSPANLTPTKMAGGEPPAADYMAIFEVTIQEKWANADRDGCSLLTRLEERLFITLARANALRGDSTAELGILNVVAVVGVVGVFNCQHKITAVRAASSGNESILPAKNALLWKLMDAGRFVFVHRPYGDSPRGSPAHST